MELNEIKGETSKIREHVMKYLVGKGLDIGCGPDKVTVLCDGLDQIAYPGVTHVGDAAHLPFEDGAFDWVFSSHALEDFEDTDKTLEEWLRVLKVGGVIILYVPHPDLYKGHNPNHKHPGWTVHQMIYKVAGNDFYCQEEFGEHDPEGVEILEAWAHDIPRETHPCHSTLVVGRRR